MSLNLASAAHISCRHFPDETALIHDNRKLTYREFLQRLIAFAAHLREIGVNAHFFTAKLWYDMMSVIYNFRHSGLLCSSLLFRWGVVDATLYRIYNN